MAAFIICQVQFERWSYTAGAIRTVELYGRCYSNVGVGVVWQAYGSNGIDDLGKTSFSANT